MRKNKYKKGPQLKDIQEVIKWIQPPLRGWIYIRNKPYHPGWIKSLQLGYLMWSIEKGMVFAALLND